MSFFDATPRVGEDGVLDLLALAVGNPTSDKLAQIATAYSSDSRCRVFALGEPDRILAVMGVRFGAAGCATILHIAVRPDQRRCGLGRQLIEEVRNHFNQRELSAETDQEGTAFYERCGFEIHPQGERYPGVERFVCRWVSV